ncbi:MAG: proline--tRNA ligase [Nevskiales bacterium]
MRLSQFPLFTAKETPADAEIVSHQLMLRAGLIRKLAAGLYTWLPLGLRVLQKVAAIVREELNRAGCVEVSLPCIQPAELWQTSGRWEAMGPEMLRLKDRHERDFCYAPTAEEVITNLVKDEYRSYKQLPVNFYQIGSKFRDERRPRFGVMRAREFLMKDGYSFHMDTADLDREYLNMRQAYSRIFERVGLEFRIVQADSGNIGGSASEEFHVLASSGEDLLAIASNGSYAANLEAAVAAAPAARSAAKEPLKKAHTPGTITCADVAQFLKLPLERTVKSVAVEANGRHYLLLLRGDHEANLVKIGKLPGLAGYRLATEAELVSVFKSVAGYIGPIGLGQDVSIIADQTVAAMSDFVCGANEPDHHLMGINWGRDLPEPAVVADIRNVVDGEAAPNAEGNYQLVRGIEVGHIFKLGRKYSTSMGVSVLDAGGKEQTPEMGTYGIGVSRIVGAAIEQSHDDNGIIWPEAIAPFRVILTPINYEKSARVKDAADALYTGLLKAGVEVLLDDRGLRPGPMFADADLIGIPHRIVIGERGLDKGMLEYKSRAGAAREIEHRLEAATAAMDHG